MNVKTYLESHKLIFDGAMGSYFSSIFADPLYKCENANLSDPKIVEKIHLEYLEAGAKAIKTNTFASNDVFENDFSYVDVIGAGFEIASRAAEKYDAFVFCDIGAINQSRSLNLFDEYKKVVDVFLDLGGKNFLFETLSQFAGVGEVCEYIKSKVADAYILVSFAVGADGFSATGNLGYELYDAACQNPAIDAVGFNCICGPHHLNEYVHTLKIQKPLSIMPNAGYPTIIGNRTHYENNSGYFAKRLLEIENAQILGGCCGTTPEFIREVNLKSGEYVGRVVGKSGDDVGKGEIKKSAFYEKLISGKMPIAVELDSPVVDDVRDFMANAQILADAGVDLLTIADCPIAKARMDSSLLACKVRREIGLDVLPHMTCRDRNINAIKALLLGLSVEDVNNVLIVTGDPIPSHLRDEVKTVYEFNSRMLINYITNLNETFFNSPFYLYGALNINAKNMNVQLRLAEEKVKKGVRGFLTQPVLNERAFENLKLAKEQLNVPILGGIYPLVSYNNACFMNNEIPGIDISDEIINLYKDKTREESSEIAVQVSVEIAKKISDYVDGYYLMTPFKRADIICKIVENLKS